MKTSRKNSVLPVTLLAGMVLLAGAVGLAHGQKGAAGGEVARLFFCRMMLQKASVSSGVIQAALRVA